ncbi:MAG: methyl-accepting chemotaxis protein [Spirochaetaceae bacterium]|nr:methyl-accepting chemotaxis protein [Spirochaetaceae bacterium]
MKIGKKLIIMIIGLAILGTGVLLGTILHSSQEQIATLIDRELENMANNEARQLAAWTESYFNLARSLAQLMEAYEEIDAGDRRFFYNITLKQVAEGNPEVAAVWTCWEPNALDGLDAQYANTRGTDATGRFISHWFRTTGGIELNALKDYTVSGPGDFYLIPLQTGIETAVEPVVYTIDGADALLTSLAVPVKPNGKVLGVVGIDITMSKFQSGVAAIMPYKGSFAEVFSNGGLVVTGQFDLSLIGQSMLDTEKEIAGDYLSEYVNAVKTGSPYSFSNLVKKPDGTKVWYKVICMPFSMGKTTTPWALALGLPYTVIDAPVLRMLRISIVISVIMLLAIAIGAFLISRSISSPIKYMMKAFSAVGEGDLTQRLDFHRGDEIGDMAGVFNGTLDKIKSLMETIKSHSVSLFDIGNELAHNMTETAAAINEITAGIQNIKGRVINQSASVTETNSTMEQITVNIDKLNSQVDRQSLSMSQSSLAIEQMLTNIRSVTQTLIKNSDNVKGLINASEVGRMGLQEVTTDIREIARESEGLLEINTVMENIASQTDLLSMNAAIEAAHAGDAGKGFAVVADEIRKLAENSGEQSKTISTVLKKIKDSIDKITKSTGSVLEKFEAIDSGIRIVSNQEENIRNAMREQGEGSKQILEALEQLTEMTRMVKGGSEEMLEGSKQVIEESRNLELATQEISNEMNEMATGAEQINAAVSRVHTISGENRGNIEILVREVSRFKIA